MLSWAVKNTRQTYGEITENIIVCSLHLEIISWSETGILAPAAAPTFGQILRWLADLTLILAPTP